MLPEQCGIPICFYFVHLGACIPVLFHKASPSEIVSPIDIDFLNLLDEPPFEVLELDSPIIS